MAKIKETSHQKSIRLSESIIENIEQMAEDDNRTFNNMVETILLNATKQHQMI